MTELLTSVSKLPKDIQRNIVQFLSLPTADMIREKAEEILQHFCSLTADKRRKYNKIPNIQSCLGCPLSCAVVYADDEYTSHYSRFDLNDTLHIRSHKTLENYGFKYDYRFNRFYQYQQGGGRHLINYMELKWHLMNYLEKNQVSYKKTSYIKTLIKLVINIPNTEGKYETKTKKTKKNKTKKTKERLVMIVD
jgi:hypothetical protein